MGTILIVSLIFSIYFVLLFLGNKLGLSVLVFVAPLVCTLLYLLKRNNKIKNSKAKILLIPIILLSSTYLIFNNKFFNRLNIIVIPILILIMIIKILNEKVKFKTLIEEIVYSLLESLSSTTEIFWDFKREVLVRININKNNENKEKNSNVIKGIFITFCLVIFIIALLCSADSGFRNLFEKIFNFIIQFFIKINTWEIVVRIFVTIAVFTCLASFLKYIIFKYELVEDNENLKVSQDTLTIKMILTSLNIVYLLFSIVQIVKIIESWNTSVNFAMQARQGFFQLMIVSFINFITILIAKKREKATKKSKYIRILSIVMIIFTVVLLICAGLRMYAYQSEYGYTLLRLLVYFALFTETILLIPTCLYILDKKVNSEKSYFTIIIVMYLVMNFANLNNIIATENVKRYFEVKKIDVNYLKNLGTDAIKQMVAILESKEADVSTKYDICLYFKYFIRRRIRRN